MTPRPTPVARGDVSEIVADLMTEIRENSAVHAPKRRSPYVRVALLGLVLVCTAAVWLNPPAWLVPPPPAPASFATREASMRVLISLTSQRVEVYRRTHGRLPSSAAEFGLQHPSLSYKRLDASTYEITGMVDVQPIIYKSTTPRQQFLGNAVTVVQNTR